MENFQDQGSFVSKNTGFFQKCKKHSFILGILLLVGVIVFGGLLTSIFSKEDRNSYIVLAQGEGYINSVSLELEEKQVLSIGDSVGTKGEESLAYIEWGDGSVTRIGGDSELLIEQLYIGEDKNTIQIGFELMKGKSWSNVISFLGEDSFFKLKFYDAQASVRGTVFNIDLDNDYASVSDHEILITRENGENYVVSQNKPLSLVSFDFIKLQEFITKIKDRAWEDMNKKIDKEFIQKLQRELESYMNDINKITSDLASKEYSEILRAYQQMKFVDSSNTELFLQKMKLQEHLLSQSTGENKEVLLRNTLYDFKDAVSQKSSSAIESMLPILNNNQELFSLPNASDFMESFTKSSVFDEIDFSLSDGLQNQIQDIANPQNIKERFDETKQAIDTLKNENIIPDVGLDDISTENISDSISDQFQETKDAFNTLKELY